VFWRLVLLLIGLPALELFVLYMLANSLPFGQIVTVLLVLGTGFLGVSLARYQGMGCWLELHRQLDRKETPTQPIANGILILIAAALLIMPGLITDVTGILLLIPPIRRGVIAYTLYRFEAYRLRTRQQQPPPSQETIDV